MGRIRNTIYLDRDLDIALRDWADRKDYSMSKASNILLRHALFDSLDEGTQAQSGAGDAPSVARGGQAGDPGEHVPAAGAQTNRLFGALAACGRMRTSPVSSPAMCSTTAPGASSGRTIGSGTPGSHPAGDTRRKNSRRQAQKGDKPGGAALVCCT